MEFRKKNQWVVFFVFCSVLLTRTPVGAQGFDPQKPIVPPKGKTLLMIGQDQSTIKNYIENTQIIPAGVMTYTSIQKLDGLDAPADYGAGILYAKALLEKYPSSYLQIGLYMVGALEQVNQGVYDENIERLAQWVKNTNRGVYLRIGYEFDLKDNGYKPTQYIKAFQRIVKRFSALGVDNVAFVWHSGAYDNVANPFLWYPGDDYVDWFAVSFFAPMQYEKIKDFYDEALLRDKPFMIAESTPAGTDTERVKQDWYKKYFYIIEEMEPQAVCYINADWDSQSQWKHMKWGDGRIQTFASIKEIWLKEMQKERYIQGRHLNATQEK